MTDKEIGEHLQISAYTANDHRKNLINKFGTRNACAMVRKAFELALLPLFSTPDMRLQTSIEKHRVHYI